MFELVVPQTVGDDTLYTTEIVYNVDDFPYSEILKFLPTCRKNRGRKSYNYYNISASFDIESTTIEPSYTMITQNGKSKKKYEIEPYGFMYHWQFCICDTVIFGRRWEEFIKLLDLLNYHLKLSEYLRLVVYVHFLPYEFQFMKDFLYIQKIFAREKRKPVSVLTDKWIEFRCSFALSNMSLVKFCENSELCTYYKLADTYDYRKLRTPDTPMEISELQYCYCDVRGLCQCIDTSLKDHTIATIPLTNTGYVRRDFRRAMKKNPNNWALLQETRLDAKLYELLTLMFRGGNTHANRFYANTIVSDMASKDLQSSYPACMMLDTFPMGCFERIDNVTQEIFDEHVYGGDACIINCTIYDVCAKSDVVIPYIDIAHCRNYDDIINDNGRVLYAPYIDITISEIDFKIIKSTYNYSGLDIHDFYYTFKAKLPVEFRQRLLVWYTKKTTLKDIIDKVYEYLKSKNRVNSAYGMMVTKIDHPVISYDKYTMAWAEYTEPITRALDNYYSNRNSFLAYQWGVWVTCNARARLQIGIDLLKTDCIYVDTDCTKYRNWQKYEHMFEEINRQIIADCENNDIPAYAIKDGKKYYLGIWDDDGHYARFKTLGAKKYATEKIQKDGSIKFGITVSGMSKELGAKAVGNMENFCIGKTYSNVGRTTSWYNDCEPHYIEINGCRFLTASNIGVLDTTYTLGVSKEYWELIVDNMSEEETEYFLSNMY